MMLNKLNLINGFKVSILNNYFKKKLFQILFQKLKIKLIMIIFNNNLPRKMHKILIKMSLLI